MRGKHDTIRHWQVLAQINLIIAANEVMFSKASVRLFVREPDYAKKIQAIFIKPFNASCSTLLLFEGFSAILV